MNLKELVVGKMVRFQYFRDNELWYKTEDGFEFPVSILEAAGGTFLAEDKALLFMRFIRKHLETIEIARAA